jgi:hypothetical protein
MATTLYNHRRPFRPLRGGVEIFNPRVDEAGTLSFIAQDAGGGPERWLVSCYHVLVGGPGTQPIEGEPVFQPSDGTEPAALTDAARAHVFLDCAAAKLAPGVAGIGEILGIGRLAFPANPEPGMRVIKSGAATGVTEGLIESVEGDDVVIAHAPDFDPNYELSLPGDSGSLWLRREDHAPVAMHLSEAGGPLPRVAARRILAVLEGMGLQMLA